MKAAYLTRVREIQIKETRLPEPKAGEVRVKIRATGICGSDVHLFLGHRLLDKPTIIGHEAFGVIDKLGKGVWHRKVGERVVVEPNIPCTQCQFCRRGQGNICLHKRVVGLNEAGCFAEYITLPEAYVWEVPDEVSDENAVVIEPTAVALHALFAAKAKPGDAIAVIGLGAIGLLLTHAALSLGYKVYTMELNPTKSALVEKQGAVPVLASGDMEAQAMYMAAFWEKHEVAAVFECAGTAQTASLAAAAAPRGSEIVLLGLSGNLATFQPLKIAREGIHIIPSIIYDHPTDFRRAIQLITTKIIQPGFILSKYIRLHELQTGLELAAAGNECKIVVHC